MKLTVYDVYDLCGHLLGTFSSMQGAGDLVGVSKEAIRQAVKHDRLCKHHYIRKRQLTGDDIINGKFSKLE